MAEVKIENIENSFDDILKATGENSFVEWEAFTKASTGLTKQMEELAKSLNIYREIQQRRFIINMKKLKSCDIPDLIKTVKSKKLPKEALKSISGRFKLNEEKAELAEPVEKIKEESDKILKEYLSSNETLVNQLK